MTGGRDASGRRRWTPALADVLEGGEMGSVGAQRLPLGTRASETRLPCSTPCGSLGPTFRATDDEDTRPSSRAGREAGHSMFWQLVILVYALMAVPLVRRGRQDLLLKLALPLFPLFVLTRVSPLLRFYWRFIGYVLGVGLFSGWGVLSALCFTLAGQAENANWFVARSFYAFISPLLGIRFTVESKENLPKDGDVGVIVGNHQSLVDVLYLGAFFPKKCSIMAKKEIRFFPLLGQFMALSNAVWVDRANRKSAVEQFNKVAQIMKKKDVSIFIFPEGTRSGLAEPGLLPFKKGAFHLAVQGQVPIYPVVCENYSKVYSTRRKHFGEGDLVIKALPRIETKGYTSSSEDIAKLSEKVRQTMLEGLEGLARRRGMAAGRSA